MQCVLSALSGCKESEFRPKLVGLARRIARSVRHPILSTITKELFNFRSRAQGYLALFPELQVRMAFSARFTCCTVHFLCFHVSYPVQNKVMCTNADAGCPCTYPTLTLFYPLPPALPLPLP